MPDRQVDPEVVIAQVGPVEAATENVLVAVHPLLSVTVTVYEPEQTFERSCDVAPLDQL